MAYMRMHAVEKAVEKATGKSPCMGCTDRVLGCSADCETMWQIGVDVLPDYRRRGVASALTGRLAREIIERGKVPFYCSAWSNIRSVRNAIRSGFIPAWVEMTVKPTRLVEEMNQTEEEKTTFETAEKSRRSRYNED